MTLSELSACLSVPFLSPSGADVEVMVKPPGREPLRITDVYWQGNNHSGTVIIETVPA